MANNNPTSAEPIIDVSTADFESAVLERSSQVPVLVDFWASWCQPCLVLGPILEKVAAELEGAFVLAKVDSDQNQDLALRYGVQGIPNVLLFKDGEAVDRFVGALPEDRVRAFLEPHLPSAARDLIAAAEEHAQKGDAAAARETYERALDEDPRSHAARLGLARLAFLAGELDSVERHVEGIPAAAEEYEAGQALLQSADLALEAAEVGDRAACEDRAAADASDVEAHYALGGWALAEGDSRRALEHYLKAAEADRRWREEAARKAMLVVFHVVGVRDPLADEFRDRLRRIYY